MEEAALKREIPHSSEAEASVIGAMFLDTEAIVTASAILKGEDFYAKQNGLLFDTIVELNENNIPVDIVTLQNRLKEKGASPEIVALEFLRDILTTVPTSANIKSYAEIVAEKSVLRKIIRNNEEISNKCYAGNHSLEDIMEETEKKTFELIQNRGFTDFVPIKQVVINSIRKISENSRFDGGVTGIPTGFIDLDNMTAGMQPSDLIIIAARPSMGKTAFALNILEHVVLRLNKCVAFFSLEMSAESLTNRLFAQSARIDAQNIRTGQLTETDWTELFDSADMIGRSKLIIDDTPGIGLAEMRSKCRKYKIEHGLEMIVVDYLQLMGASGGRSESRQQEISAISRGLKSIARELDVPLIALSQLSRASEKRDDKKPIMSDLRDSGGIEQDADVIMFIHREEYYNKDTDKKDIAEIIIGKQRNGPTGIVKLKWRAQYTMFGNLEKEYKKNTEGE